MGDRFEEDIHYLAGRLSTCKPFEMYHPEDLVALARILMELN